jgi:hypothetical protein
MKCAIRMSCAILLAVALHSAAQAGPPDACSFLSASDWSAALGRQVTGGKSSVVDNPQSTTSMCAYMAGSLMIVYTVNQLPNAEAANMEFSEQLDNSRGRDQQKTVTEAGLGDAAFSSTTADGNSIELMALHGSRVIDIGLVGAGSAAIPRDRIRSQMQKALAH